MSNYDFQLGSVADSVKVEKSVAASLRGDNPAAPMGTWEGYSSETMAILHDDPTSGV
jgi:hypothetical protein